MDIKNEVVKDRINRAIDAAFPNGGGGILTEQRLRTFLETVAGEAYTQGEHDARANLLTLEEAADILGCSVNGLKHRIDHIHAEHPNVGWNVSGKVWLVTRESLPHLAPKRNGRPRG